MSKSTVNELFQAAQHDGVLSPGSTQALIALDIGVEIANALGTPALDVKSSEVVLVTMMIDDSGSIQYADNEQIVRDGHNMVIDALTDTSRLTPGQIDSILSHTCYLNGGMLNPYAPIANAIRMDSNNYQADGGTPLYDQTMVLLAKVIGKSQEFANEGVPVRTITLIVTDGEDQHSTQSTPNDVARLLKDMLMQETHIVAAMGIDNGNTDFNEVFARMGLKEEWVLTPANNEHDIRNAFRLFSQSAQAGSKTVQSYTAMGGFGA